MLSETKRTYIANLPIGAPAAALQPEEELTAIDVNKLPDGVITGSNLIQFPKEATPELRASVSLSLLAAQRVASNDHGIITPDQWIDRHNTILMNLNWLKEGGGTVKSHFDSINVAVHEAIIPFLTAAFGPAIAAGALIVTALKQLKDMDKNSPWITLFDRQSRRFEVTEYQFSVVQVVGNQVHLNMASARFDGSYGKTQVLFFKVSKQKAEFDTASARFSAQADLLTEMNGDLKIKLANLTKSFIQQIPDDLLKGV